MGDGPSDAAYAAEAQARRFIKKNYPGLELITSNWKAPLYGQVVLLYEEYLRHVIELISGRQVVERWIVEPYHKMTTQVEIGERDWPVGYYERNRIPRHRKEYWRSILKVIRRRKIPERKR